MRNTLLWVLGAVIVGVVVVYVSQMGAQSNVTVTKEKTDTATTTLIQTPSQLENGFEDVHVNDTNTDSVEPQSSSDEESYEGVHIMADGTIMGKDGRQILGAVLLSNGSIQLNDGTIITPAFDLRTKTDQTQTQSSAHHEFVITGTDFAYDIKQIKVKKGDTVTINFKSADGFHDWVVDVFDAATKRVDTGGSASVTFVADEVGTFQYYCSVMNHRQMGMVGYIVVE